MKYGIYLEQKARAEWRQHYLDYSKLKDLIDAAVKEDSERADGTAYSLRVTSLTVQRPDRSKEEGAHERFCTLLSQEIDKISKFVESVVQSLRSDMASLSAAVDSDRNQRSAHEKEAQRLGDEFLQLEKYVNLNYMGFHKILKKHDKNLPQKPVHQFFINILHNQPWAMGNYSDLLVKLSNVYSNLRGDVAAKKNEDAAQGFVRSTTKFWVRTADVSTVKHIVLQHLPVFQFNKDDFAGDAQLLNSVYLDNSSLELYHGRLDKKPLAIAMRIRWYGPNDPAVVYFERKTHHESWTGEESVKERFEIEGKHVMPFLLGEFKLEDAVKNLHARGKGKDANDKFKKIFTECQQAVDSKQLLPLIRTQYMRTAFQIPFDSTVRMTLDTNLCMIKENPEDGPSCLEANRFYRDPSLPIQSSEITRFPHAVLEVKLSLQQGESAPAWVKELIDSGLLTEVHKFSKFIHGSCTLYPEMVQSVPYWVDDESVRPSMVMSAPRGSNAVARRLQGGTIEPTHPLLGNQPRIQMINNPADQSRIAAMRKNALRARDCCPIALCDTLLGVNNYPLPNVPQRIEPKSFFANERTFLSWLNMSITIGSIATALLGYSGTTKRSHATGKFTDYTVDLLSLILLPLSVVIAAYALGVFFWRAASIRGKRVEQFDDPKGPMVLAGCVILSLTTMFFLNLVDLASSM